MEKLNPDWFVEGLVDFEYKKYLLLAYLKNVGEKFNQTKLYPHLAELVFHYRNLTAFSESREKMNEKFPSAIKTIDMEKAKVEFESLIQDDEVMKEIALIVDYSIPKFRSSVEEGREIYEFIEENIEIDPVGIVPLYKDEGYLLVHGAGSPTVKAYDYQVSIIHQSDESYRSIRTSFVNSFEWGIANTFEDMKLDLIRNFQDKPNPATFIVAANLEFPEDETLLPVAKRKFIRYLAAF